MSPSLRRVRLGFAVLALVVVSGVLGYRVLDGRTWLEAVYMVVITLASVGYTERSQLSPTMQLFTMGLILVGVVTVAYTLGGIVQFMTEGEIERVLGHRRTARGIEQLNNHVIICGFGRIGQILAHDLQHFLQPFVVIDNEPRQLVEASERNYLGLHGDATEEDVLRAAGVERARSLVTALPSDAANVFITLTARNLNPGLQIIARAEHRSSEKKLKQAGASRVVMPASIGARRMARMITHPSTADLIEQVAESSHLNVELDEVSVGEGSQLVGRTVQEASAAGRFNLLVVAVKQSAGDLVFNPDPGYAFRSADTVILIGRVDDVQRFRAEFKL